MTDRYLTNGDRELLQEGAALYGWADHATAEANLENAVESLIRRHRAEAWAEGFKHRHSGGRVDETDPTYTVYGPNPYRETPPGS